MLNPGDIVYICVLEVSKGGRITRKIPPTEVKILEIDKYHAKITGLDGGYSYVSRSSIYQTYSEAKDSWNSMIENEINRLKSIFENTKKRLSKNII